MKTAVIGADGQLGSDLCKVLPARGLVALTIKDLDITAPIEAIDADIIINTAAFHRVDDCEEQDLEAYNVNAHGVKNLALYCQQHNKTLVHISTDYVFDGKNKKPYTEDDAANPQTAYGVSKLAGEFFVKYLLKNHFIIRTSGLYGTAGCLGKGGTNFVEGMIKRAAGGQQIRVVDDEVLTPTYTLDLARNLARLIETERFGTYHMTNHGQCSWWQMTAEIFKLLKMDVKVEKASGDDFPTKAKRPKYSVLDNRHLKKIGLDSMMEWRDALKAYLVEKGHLKIQG
ncbi:MAG: dTDP-4-dehydrorhamnose reductase [Candidatus Margulisbacteria bacterium]|nr:dTDP-4-dehydrorhamnose reductase [Candidatus Margulisiibacteriota bacterium]